MIAKYKCLCVRPILSVDYTLDGPGVSPEEGLMTMPIVQLETEHAGLSLQQKMADCGLKVQATDESVKRLRVEYDLNMTSDVAETITSFIFSDWCYQHIYQRVGLLHDYLTDDEQEYIALLTFHSMRQSDEEIAGMRQSEWNTFILGSVAQVLDSGADPQFVYVDGLMRFRAKKYLTVIDKGIHEVIEQFLADREYEEFVSMLRYMLDSQPASSQVLHVFSANDRVWISDASGELVKDAVVTEAAQHASDDGDVNPEDLAMSILITRAPCQIVIHDLTMDAPWPSFAETVEKVFLGRATRCQECSACKQLKLSKEGYQNLPVHRNAIPDKYE